MPPNPDWHRICCLQTRVSDPYKDLNLLRASLSCFRNPERALAGFRISPSCKLSPPPWCSRPAAVPAFPSSGRASQFDNEAAESRHLPSLDPGRPCDPAVHRRGGSHPPRRTVHRRRPISSDEKSLGEIPLSFSCFPCNRFFNSCSESL